MTYDETLDFLFNRLQSFHNDGAKAYKPGLEKAYALSAAFGNPHTKFRAIHVGGTNGKGSTAHSIASVLMAAGLKTGLYTSPHLVDFSERIRIDGRQISRDEVVDFTRRFVDMGLQNTNASFFELTTIMVFEHFARHNVDVAVIEVGLGGRLDTTNIITPELSVVTNVSFDHTALLGNTLPAIAAEKAGIIKPGIPAIIGRRNPLTDPVFAACGDNVRFAPDMGMYSGVERHPEGLTYTGTPWGDVTSCLTGDCQPENTATILAALYTLQQHGDIPRLSRDVVDRGLRNVCRATGLMGRWMTLSTRPHVVADTAHNVDGWRFIAGQLSAHLPSPLHVVLGFVSDKDYQAILHMLPPQGHYYFTQPSVHRAANAADVAAAAHAVGLSGDVYPTVADAYRAAAADATAPDALLYVGGSTFVVADLLSVTSDISDISDLTKGKK